MKKIKFGFASPYRDTPRKAHVPVIFVRTKKFSAWLKKQPRHVKNLCLESGFSAQPDKVLTVRDAQGRIESLILGAGDICSVYSSAHAVAAIRNQLSKDFIAAGSFYFEAKDLTTDELFNAHVGWALGCYDFTNYKKGPPAQPALVWSKGVDKKKVFSLAESIFLLRDMVNTPANDMGPDELELAARHVAKKPKAQVKIIRDAELLDKNFPLIHAVGHGSDRRPRLIEMTWGDAKNPRLTLVGKGVCFDTGGLNIKPGPSMALMKKDMGGAAHVLTLGKLIMELKLPVRLRILIPAVENSVSGRAFRPGDIFSSRKGITVENTNTDAEGRLILADALTYACEDKPDMIVDFATLTGSARVALGPDIPPVFSNNDSITEALRKISWEIDDPVWPMPLWQPYRKLIESPVADLLNSSSVPGDLIYSALFLQQFLTGKPDWLHLDVYAWEHTGKPGRPRGGADTALRAVLGLIEQRYDKKAKRR